MVKNGIDDARRQFFRERPSVGGHLVKHCADGVDISAGVHGLALELFWRHIG